ncbi:MAG: hypothetical protein H0X45_06655 [Planctomycetes bacterium]|nr:hypothetical protein [Planctomycetota bacterium]
MRIGDQAPPPTIAARPEGPACEAACAKPPPAQRPVAEATTWLDRVGSLVDRLAVETRALIAGRGTAPSAADDVLGMMQDVFGIGPIAGVDMSFDYEHATAVGASASRAETIGAAGSGAAWRNQFYASESTAFSAAGVITGADGTRYAFTLDYTAVTEVAAVEEGFSISGPSARFETPAWSLPETAIPTIELISSTAESLIERLRRLLGIEQTDDAKD